MAKGPHQTKIEAVHGHGLDAAAGGLFDEGPVVGPSVGAGAQIDMRETNLPDASKLMVDKLPSQIQRTIEVQQRTVTESPNAQIDRAQRKARLQQALDKRIHQYVRGRVLGQDIRAVLLEWADILSEG